MSAMTRTRTARAALTSLAGLTLGPGRAHSPAGRRRPDPCPDGKVWAQAHATGDHRCVSPTEVGRRMTPFDAARHGFGFDNRFQTQPIAEMRFGGLCGGMVVRGPRPLLPRPPDSHPEHRAAGRIGAAPLHLRPAGRVDHPEPRQVGRADRQPVRVAQRRVLQLGSPGLQRRTPPGAPGEHRRRASRCALGLFKPTGNPLGPHHQVIAVGYDLGRYAGDFGPHQTDLRIFVVDPNFPGRITDPGAAAVDAHVHLSGAPRQGLADLLRRHPLPAPEPSGLPEPARARSRHGQRAGRGAVDGRGRPAGAGTTTSTRRSRSTGRPPVVVANLNRGRGGSAGTRRRSASPWPGPRCPPSSPG